MATKRRRAGTSARRPRTPAARQIAEARRTLEALNVPREQRNDRSALTLLALLDLKPRDPWSAAGAPLIGITEMIDYFRDHYRKNYAPNTRETVRRQTVHQFVQMGLVVANPDDPSRPVNSPDTRYQIESSALDLLRTVGSGDWEVRLTRYFESAAEIRRLHSREREMKLISVKLPDGREVRLTPGGQNVIVKAVLEEFCPRFAPGATVIYVGDTGEKHLLFETGYLADLGVQIDGHGKMPDVVVHMRDRDWLLLIEVVTSHGPIGIKRHNELRGLFESASCGLVFVTAFPSRALMIKYLNDIAWETEVWIADAPSHMIHFNGERFLGPY